LTQGEGAPRAGWYDDPRQPGRLRWWDGERWTDHTEARPESPQSPQPSQPNIDAMLAAAASARHGGTDPGSRSLLPWIIGGSALLVLLLITAIVLSSSGGNGAEAGTAVGDPLAADRTAQELTRTAQTAIETYGVDHNASYAGATPTELVTIESTLEGADLSVAATAVGYSISVGSESGNTFTIVRNQDGSVSFTCTTTGYGGCPTGGNWGF
jgi:hypothetical protein